MEKPEEEGEDHINKLPDDILVRILSMCLYMDAVRTASVSRRWERLVAQLPDLDLCMSALGYLAPIGTPSSERVRSMARTLRRRCRGDDGSPTAVVKALHLSYRHDVPMECRYAEEFATRANAAKLVLHVQCEKDPRDEEDAGAWSLQLPPATTELHVVLYSYALRPPRIHGGPGVDTLRSLMLQGPTVLRQQGFFLLLSGGLLLPSLEDLRIAQCTLAASIDITSDGMPRLKHLDITDVSVMTDGAAINVLADGLRTFRMSCHMWSSTEPPSQRQMFRLRSLFQARFTMYSSFRLRAPRLRVFEWRCYYADELRIESVGRLSGVAVEIAAGMVPRRFGDQGSRYVTIQQRDKLMTDILQGLMPGLQPRTWKDVKRNCMQSESDDRWLCFEITSACSPNEHGRNHLFFGSRDRSRDYASHTCESFQRLYLFFAE